MNDSIKSDDKDSIGNKFLSGPTHMRGGSQCLPRRNIKKIITTE